MKDKIGEIAGKIWTILGEKQNVDILKLPKVLKGRDCLPSFGLAGQGRQNKLSHQGKTFVSLSHEEGEMFKNSPEAFAKSDP